jgi:hypothetical protein
LHKSCLEAVEKTERYFLCTWKSYFVRHGKYFVILLNTKMVPFEILLLVNVEYLELSRKPGLNLWNWNLRTKNLIFRRIFAKKTKLRGNWTLPSSFLKVTARELLPGAKSQIANHGGFLRKNRFIHVLEKSKSTQNKQLYLDVNTKKRYWSVDLCFKVVFFS